MDLYFFMDALHHFLLGSSLTITSLPGLVSLSLAFNSLRYACNCYHKWRNFCGVQIFVAFHTSSVWNSIPPRTLYIHVTFNVFIINVLLSTDFHVMSLLWYHSFVVKNFCGFCRLASYCESFIELVNKVLHERHNHKSFPTNLNKTLQPQKFSTTNDLCYMVLVSC